MTKEYVKKELKKLFKSMDFISNNFLNREDIKELQTYFDIYQHLGIAWEFLGLQCGHWEGYKKTRDRKEVCRICGKVRDVDETYYPLYFLREMGGVGVCTLFTMIRQIFFTSGLTIKSRM
jgi:hypothetical protein